MPETELEVKNLKVAFETDSGELAAVNGISYQIKRGETLAIVGESGSGKTVSALSILRLVPEPPGKMMSGKILFNSTDLAKLSQKEMRELRGRDISMIFQDPMTSLNPVLTVGEQIIETIIRHTPATRDEARKKAIELLRRVDIPSPDEKIKQFPHQLSGGMRQRVMIAIALCCSPRILIADEPTTALDVLVQAQLLNLLEQLKRENEMSILLITHDLGVVSDIAQRVLVMYAGEIVESGPVDRLFQSPLHPYTLGLIHSFPKMEYSLKSKPRLDEIPGNPPSLKKIPKGCPFHTRCPSVMERCKTEKPVLKMLTPGHEVNCWLHSE